MEAIELNELCAECGVERAKLDEIRKRLGIKCQKRNNRWTISVEEAEILRRELSLPEELQPVVRQATGLHPANNPHWFYCAIDGLEGKHPVKIPRNLWGRLAKKRFDVELIEDANGSTWRHACMSDLRKYAN